jgi:energy-coupling factor transport system substrate-specific component
LRYNIFLSGESMRRPSYTAIDYAVLGAIAVAFGIMFAPWWTVYYGLKSALGPIPAKLITYGLWFFPAPLAAVILKKPLSAFMGETLAALVESLIPNAGGFTNLIYGLAQGAFSEIAFAAGRYKRFGAFISALSGALAGIPSVLLDAVLYSSIYPLDYMIYIIIAVMASGAIYGYLAYLVGKVVK